MFDTQPLPPGDPIFDLANLLLTPHAEALTATSSRAMAIGAAEEMLRFLLVRRPRNLVNPDYAEVRRASLPSV